MAFRTVPVQIAGPSYMSRSRPLSSQSTVNFYQEFNEAGKAPFVIHSWPGEKLLGSGVGADRGQHVMAGIEYRVAGSNLYEVSRDGTHTNRGTVSGGSRCIMANDGVNLFIVNAGIVQQYSSDTQAITSVTDADIVGATAVDYLNNQFIYTKPNLFIISNVGDGSTASGLNAAQAEAQPDDLERAFVFEDTVYMLGTESIERWYNTGVGNPPFARITGGTRSIGIAAAHSVASNDEFMYWLSDDRQVYQASGGSERRVSSIAIAHAIENYDAVDDAVGWTMTLEGQNFYILSFPSANKTWAISEALGENGWFELSADTNQGKYNCTSHSYAYNKHLVADETNGNLYELDLNTFDNNGETIHRTRVLSSIHGGLFEAPGKRVQMSRFELILETGVGTISGQGEDPKIMIEASYDGGRSFAPGTWMRIGRLGETNIKAEWWEMVSFYDLIIKITTSDPVAYSIQSGAIDIRLAGR